MRVILPVTGIAIGRERDLGDIAGDVAGLAIKVAMRARQGITGLLVVIEAPACPAVGVVTKPAVRREAPLMMLVRMAGDAGKRRALEYRGAVAFLAGHDGVAPDQGKSRNVVIESDAATPIRLIVALLAPGSELPLMTVILAVAGRAGGRQLVAVEIAGVAGVTTDLGVCPAQGIFGRLVVIEVAHGPLLLIVAAVALRPVPSAVDVLNLVAIRAGGADALVAFVHMARGTGHCAVRALQAEFGAIVIEGLHALPRGLVMAIPAAFPQAPLVRIAFLVTVEAALGRVAEFRGSQMTSAARYDRMGVPQREIRKAVLESLGVQLDDVSVPPFVIRVTMVALELRGLGITPVESPARLAIGAGILVTVEAQAGLRRRGKRRVAIGAVTLELGMSRHQRPRRDQMLEQILRSPG